MRVTFNRQHSAVVGKENSCKKPIAGENIGLAEGGRDTIPAPRLDSPTPPEPFGRQSRARRFLPGRRDAELERALPPQPRCELK